MFGAVGGCRSIDPEACEEKSGNLLSKNQLVACSNVRAGTVGGSRGRLTVVKEEAREEVGWRQSGEVDGGEGGGEGGGRLAAVGGSWGRI